MGTVILILIVSSNVDDSNFENVGMHLFSLHDNPFSSNPRSLYLKRIKILPAPSENSQKGYVLILI